MVADKDIKKETDSGISMTAKPEVCPHYGANDYAHYLSGAMKEDLMPIFERHSRTCSLCQRGVQQAHALVLSEIDERHRKRFLEIAMQKIEEKFSIPQVSIIDILLSALGKTLQIIKTTADVIMPEPSLAARGGPQSALQSPPVRLIQTIASPPLSVQLVLSLMEDSAEIELTITALDRSADDFIKNYSAEIKGPAGTIRESSRPGGELVCRIAYPGSYTISLERDGKHLCEVKIGFS